jgi:hypothetical protein
MGMANVLGVAGLAAGQDERSWQGSAVVSV